MKTNKQNHKYGLFYKSHGKWIGPYIHDRRKGRVEQQVRQVRQLLKARVWVKKMY